MSSSKSRAAKPASNGKAPPEEKASVVKFVTATDDPEPPELEQVSRDPYPREPPYDYWYADFKAAGLIDMQARLDAAPKEALVTKIIRIYGDEHAELRDSRMGRRVRAAVDLWHRRNPEIEDERVAKVLRDLRGRHVRGAGRVVAALLEQISADPSRIERLSEPERLLMRFWLPEIEQALVEAEHTRTQHLERVAALVTGAQESSYPPGEPGVAVDREEAIA